jgi:hypothetical protein
MEHLCSRAYNGAKLVHGDLAVRNILFSYELRVKITSLSLTHVYVGGDAQSADDATTHRSDGDYATQQQQDMIADPSYVMFNGRVVPLR